MLVGAANSGMTSMKMLCRRYGVESDAGSCAEIVGPARQRAGLIEAMRVSVRINPVDVAWQFSRLVLLDDALLSDYSTGPHIALFPYSS